MGTVGIVQSLERPLASAPSTQGYPTSIEVSCFILAVEQIQQNFQPLLASADTSSDRRCFFHPLLLVPKSLEAARIVIHPFDKPLLF